MKEKYVIYNKGCDDTTKGIFEFTKEEFLFLNNLFKELNKNSYYGCMPKIFIYKQDNLIEKGCEQNER